MVTHRWVDVRAGAVDRFPGFEDRVAVERAAIERRRAMDRWLELVGSALGLVLMVGFLVGIVLAGVEWWRNSHG